MVWAIAHPFAPRGGRKNGYVLESKEKGYNVKKSSIITIGATVSAMALILTGCQATDGGDAGGDDVKRACVMLPDAASSPRWEGGDRPALEKAFADAGIEADIQNAQGDATKYATLADQQLTKGCDVMLLVDINGAAVQVTEKAQAQGIPVIAYDRPIPGADYYVSFDNFRVGEAQGQIIVDALEEQGKDPATAVVVYMGGDPTDGNAKMFRDGADSIMSAAGIVPAAEPQGVWDGNKSAVNFEQALTSLGGNVDAVWVANDSNAAGVITILDKYGLTVPVTGQDASTQGLQNVLLGKQTATVYKPFIAQADAASKLAIQLINGETPDDIPLTLEDGTPYIAVDTITIYAEDVQVVVDAGDASAEDICIPAVLEACEQFGIQ